MSEELPTSVEELQRLLKQIQQQNLELAATVDSQKQRLEKSERAIRELLQALRGKQRERVDPNQLLLFEIGELEQLIEEKAAEQDEADRPARRRRERQRRVLPDNLPREEIVTNCRKNSGSVRSTESRCPSFATKPANSWISSRQS